jgi:hypothetical protein
MYHLDIKYNMMYYKILMDYQLLNDKMYIYELILHIKYKLLHIFNMFLNKYSGNILEDMMNHMYLPKDYNIVFMYILFLSNHLLKIQVNSYIYLSYKNHFYYTNLDIFFYYLYKNHHNLDIKYILIKQQ